MPEGLSTNSKQEEIKKQISQLENDKAEAEMMMEGEKVGSIEQQIQVLQEEMKGLGENLPSADMNTTEILQVENMGGGKEKVEEMTESVDGKIAEKEGEIGKVEEDAKEKIKLEKIKQIGFNFSDAAKPILGVISSQPEKFFDSKALIGWKASNLTGNQGLYTFHQKAFESINAFENGKLDNFKDAKNLLEDMIENMNALTDSFKERKMFGIGGPEVVVKKLFIEKAGMLVAVAEQYKDVLGVGFAESVQKFQNKITNYCK